MKINVLSIFPTLFSSFVEAGIVGRAHEKGILNIEVTNIRDFASDSYRTVDNYPYGGGAGMIMMVEPVVRALESVKERGESFLLSPGGTMFDQNFARELSRKEVITLVCGRYKGVDERIREFVDEEISIGDYILSGGEVPAMVIIESVARLLPGAVGDPESVESDSFENGLLDSPRYTRPRIFRGREVPPVLLSGNHKEIKRWRREQAIRRTKGCRRDLIT
ncbi:MAG: tRNA (guanosine(37)-N1)-methyltransferase TrmD [candidate division WOR-3 bacterium]|nr:tRNA (guanosine(37)-N1)-methyltransferase TrmD [candidate division WOR-3 bacterium]